MADETQESILYDYNYNLFLAKTMLPNVRNLQDRETVVRWLRFLKSCPTNIDEMKLRNDFMYYLVLNIQEGTLKAPFDKPPPNEPLMTMVALLPDETDNEAAQFSRTSASPPRKRSELLRRSPDGGDFLLSQPIPDVGAFCYMAVVTKKKNVE